MNMKISKRDAALILGLLGVLVIAAVYNFVYKSYSEKTDVLKAENKAIERRVNILQDLANQRETLLESTESSREETRKILERFPSDIREEDAIMLAVYLQNQAPYETISNVGIGSGMEISNILDIDARVAQKVADRLGEESAGEADSAEQAPAQETSAGTEEDLADGVSLDGHYTLMKREIQITGTCTYEGFKESVKMLAERNDRTQFTVTASYDIESGLVDAQLVMGTYYMTGTGKLYQPPNIPFISQGTSNIFGTISLEGRLADLQEQPAQDGETEEAEETEETEE